MGATRIKKATGSSSRHLSQLLSWGLPSILTLSYLILALQSDLSLAFPALIGAWSVIIMSLGTILYAGERETLGIIFICVRKWPVIFMTISIIKERGWK